nr:carboxypeptidase-like regulatory domain-containing protein [Saprospiraceae bacterium]
MKYTIFAVLLLQLVLSPRLNGQEKDDFTTITGQIQDLETKEPLSFASIYLLGTTVGTTSNTEGEFIFHIPRDLPNDTLVVSLIGYNTLKKKLAHLVKDEVFFLEQNTVELTEIVVTDEKRLTAKEIVQKAYRALPQNYPSEPYILEGFVRDLQNEDDAYVEYMECAVKMKYQRYNLARRPQVELQAVRRSYIAKKHPWNKGQERKNTIVDIVEDEFIRYNYGPIRAKGGWKYEIESVLPYDGRF